MRKHISFILACVLLFLISTPIRVSFDLQDSSFYKSTRISDAPTITLFVKDKLLSVNDFFYDHHVEPTLAISDNGTIFAGWKNSETHNGGGAEVSFAKSGDGGNTWSFPKDMKKFEGIHTRKSDPWLVWHDGSIYYAYLEFSVNDNSLSQITLAKSSDYGETWNQAAASNGLYFADKETMVITDNGTIFVAYDDVDTDPEGLATVRLTRSVDGGSNFEEVSVISPAAYGHVGPYLTLDNESKVFVAWTYFYDVGGNLLIDNSTDFGLSFGEDRIINSDGNYSAFTDADGRPAKTTLPVIRFDSVNRLYCLWADAYDPSVGSFDVYLRYSEDFGYTWSDRFLINHLTDGDQWMPDMDIDSNDRLHVVYYSEQFSSYKPYYRMVSFTGASRDVAVLSDAISVTGSLTSSEFTRPGDYCTIRLDSNDIPHVVWTDGRYDELDIFYSYGFVSEPATTETSTTTITETSTESTTDDTTTTEVSRTSQLPLVLGAGMGFTVVLIVAIVVMKKSELG
ncbi:MAG: sialidase family protein [Candidatus Thorarchaeota archaeon]